MKKKDTSWNKVSKWYSDKVGSKQSYFHENLIIPGIKKLLNIEKTSKVLDLACGEGFLSRSLPFGAEYLGIDLAKKLIENAKKVNKSKTAKFMHADVSRDLQIPLNHFDFATIILAIQNIENVDGVLKNVQKSLKKGGKLLIIMNHPAFRIPKHTGWDINHKAKYQRRWVGSYMSELKIPIDMTPGSSTNKEMTWSFHRPLEYYSKLLNLNNFSIELIEEWKSDKKSVGKAATYENHARNEIPMFMTILASKR